MEGGRNQDKREWREVRRERRQGGGRTNQEGVRFGGRKVRGWRSQRGVRDLWLGW